MLVFEQAVLMSAFKRSGAGFPFRGGGSCRP
jgi:hypothetical protein